MREFKLSNPLLSKEQYEEMYAESFNNKEQFWSKVAKSQLTWSKAVSYTHLTLPTIYSV